jgi:hypothetical protein
MCDLFYSLGSCRSSDVEGSDSLDYLTPRNLELQSSAIIPMLSIEEYHSTLSRVRSVKKKIKTAELKSMAEVREMLALP